jgi:hypothetical protein
VEGADGRYGEGAPQTTDRPRRYAAAAIDRASERVWNADLSDRTGDMEEDRIGLDPRHVSPKAESM